MIHFVFSIVFVLILVFGGITLYGNIAISILVPLTNKQYSSFFKRVCVFQKICLKVSVLKTFKTSSNCHLKTCQFLKRRANLKIPNTFFKRTYALLVAFEMKFLRKCVFLCWDKKQLKFCHKPCWNADKSNHSFLPVWWITFFKCLYSLIFDNGN